MTEYLEARVGKFIFKVAKDRLYTAEGLWVAGEGEAVRVGVTDYLQQRSGDVAFAEVRPAGTTLEPGDELATLETIKVNTSLPVPVGGRVVQTNPALEGGPELINMAPYGEGWLAVMQAAHWEADRTHLLSPEQYFEQMKQQAEQDVRKP